MQSRLSPIQAVPSPHRQLRRVYNFQDLGNLASLVSVGLGGLWRRPVATSESLGGGELSTAVTGAGVDKGLRKASRRAADPARAGPEIHDTHSLW